MKRILAVLLFFGTAPLVSAQEGPVPRVQSSITTSGASLSMGQRIAVQNFTLEDYVISSVLLTWTPATASAGRHFVEHKWLQNGNLLSDYKKVVVFDRTPVNLYSRRAAAALGKGHFEVQTLMDGNVIGDEQFDIAK